MVVVLAIAIPLSVHAGFFERIFGTPAEATEMSHVTASEAAANVPLLAAQQNPNPSSGSGGAEIIVDEDALVSSGPVGEDEIAKQRSSSGEIKVHTVRPCTDNGCETISHIADMYGVTVNTILWANDINDPESIQAGDTLVILPIVGVRHVVKSGDTISTIAKKYEGNVDEILSYNRLISEELSTGDTLIIPGGAMHAAPVSQAPAAQPTRVTGQSSASVAGFSHPAPGAIKTQGIHGYNAVDLAGGHGTAVRAAAAGEVIVSKSSGWNGGYGQYVVVRHANGAQTLYAHLASNTVGVGVYVGQGETIGTMGSTGRSTGTHLHFEVRGARNPF